MIKTRNAWLSLNSLLMHLWIINLFSLLNFERYKFCIIVHTFSLLQCVFGTVVWAWSRQLFIFWHMHIFVMPAGKYSRGGRSTAACFLSNAPNGESPHLYFYWLCACYCFVLFMKEKKSKRQCSVQKLNANNFLLCHSNKL